MTQTARTEFTADAPLNLTAAAQAKLSELLADAGDEVRAIRVFVAGGGCSGMGYGMTFTDQITDYDHAIEGAGFRVVIDVVALNYLRGAEIDFSADSLNPTFVFRNAFQSDGGGGCGGGGCGGGCGR